ncbi:MAG: hypothetical protein NXH97_06185 [Rhodobacteraceae bacterium]|nr:hypothetical protein [Paracoccaceae bacterium]
MRVFSNEFEDHIARSLAKAQSDQHRGELSELGAATKMVGQKLSEIWNHLPRKQNMDRAAGDIGRFTDGLDAAVDEVSLTALPRHRRWLKARFDRDLKRRVSLGKTEEEDFALADTLVREGLLMAVGNQTFVLSEKGRRILSAQQGWFWRELSRLAGFLQTNVPGLLAWMSATVMAWAIGRYADRFADWLGM